MSLINLSEQEKKQLSEWMGVKNCSLSRPLYSAERDGCSAGSFHTKCDNYSPVLVVASNTAGYVFGGYAPVPWVAENTRMSAPKAFLFRLRKNNVYDAVKLAGASDAVIVSDKTYGPHFGDSGGTYALRLLSGNAVTKKPGENFFTCPMNIDRANEHGFQQNGLDNNALHGGNKQLINIEVFLVVEDDVQKDDLLPTEWRKAPSFSEASLAQLKEELKKFAPPKPLAIPKANILLIGQVGSGKSSFYNSLNSAFQGHVSVKATSGSAGQSVTTKYRQYDLRPGRGKPALKLRLCDTMGLEDDQGLNISDVPYILDGYLQDGFQFNPSVLVTPKHPDYNPLPKDKDCIHVVAIIVDSSTVLAMSAKLLEKLKNIVMHAHERGIPVAVVLTKIDEISPEVSADVSQMFSSPAVKDRVDNIAAKLGTPRNCVLPVKNYDSEVELERTIDILSLYTLRFLTQMAGDAFDSMMEQKGLYEEDAKE